VRDRRTGDKIKVTEFQAEISKSQELVSNQRSRSNITEQELLERRTRLKEQDAAIKNLDSETLVKAEEYNRKEADKRLMEIHFKEECERLERVEGRMDEVGGKF